ncbi:hypothetical protein FRC12_014166 [Ceratobasidium sp. 428]|nr:hypothetical protein FRC09_013550 [Ceratobasidium sp. 395]KAG8747034.1 hypothetical protein FRC12_014166 [Ceratobasidium sp. 428]
MPSTFTRDVKQDTYEPVPLSEDEVLVVGLDNIKTQRKRRCRRILVRLFSLIALIFIGRTIYQGIFAYKFVHHNVECVPYEGGTTVVNLPIVKPGSKVLIDSSVSSNDITITHVETESNEIKFTLVGQDESLETTTEVRLCTLKSRKVVGLGLYAQKNKHEDVTLPVIKSLKVEIPTSIPPPSIDFLPPKAAHGAAKYLKWAGVWTPEHPSSAKFSYAVDE